MNPLFQYLNLFANGKFKLKHGSTIHKPTEWGVDGGTICIFKAGEVRSPRYPLNDQCALIARPIEDMSANEIADIYASDSGTEWRRKHLMRQAKAGTLPFDRIMRLLAIGVYIGPQPDFRYPALIDSRTLKEKQE